MSGAASRSLADWLADPPAAPALLDGERRRAAAERFRELGLPTRRQEAWRYTDLGGLGGETFALPGEDWPSPVAAQLDALVPSGVDAHTLIFVNGLLRDDLSRVGDLPPGSGLGSLKGMARAAAEGVDGARAMLETLDRLAAENDGPFHALSSALAGEGCGLYLPDGAVLERPVQVIHLLLGDQALLVQPRMLVMAGRGSRATVFESHGGREGSRTFCNSVAEFHLDEDAAVEHVRVQRDGPSGRRVCGLTARLAAGAEFRSHTFTLGGELVRNETRVKLEGPGARGEVNGLYLLKGESHVDNHTLIEHLSPDCTSGQVFKGVLDERSRGVFTGRILVAQDAQRTDAEQSSDSLLLSDKARGWTRPQLEIHADDVKCSHGATVGSLDEDSLFYLRARGIPGDLAKRLLIHAFASGLLGRVRTAPLLAPLDRLITRTLAE